MRFAFIMFVLLCLPHISYGVVMPEDEWFDSQEKEAEWQRMWPVLNEWEFGDRELLTGPVHESFAGIQQYLGLPAEDVAAELGVSADSPKLLRFDLNLDERVNHFDRLLTS